MRPIYDLQSMFADQIRTAETESNRVFETVIGIVTDNKDPQKLGRVKVAQRLLSLGRLSAGLTHELNNPAAAAVRATAALRERVSRMRGKLAHLASGKVRAKTAAGSSSPRRTTRCWSRSSTAISIDRW